MSLVLDAGALIAVERLDAETMALLKHDFLNGRAPVTHGGVLGQVWRGGSGRQANLARFLPGVSVASLDAALGRRAGVLLRLSRTADVVDAALVLLAEDGDLVLTSDPNDLAPLAEAAGLQVDIVPI